MTAEDLVPCPRCGHDNPGDPSRRPDGDHLVTAVGAIELAQLPDTATESFRFTARQDVRFVWCSTRIRTPAPECRWFGGTSYPELNGCPRPASRRERGLVLCDLHSLALHLDWTEEMRERTTPPRHGGA